MKKLFYFLLVMAGTSLFAVACEDDKNDGPDNSLGKAVEGTYPIAYLIDDVYFESTAVVTKSSDISAILKMVQGEAIPENRANLGQPAESDLVFTIGFGLTEDEEEEGVINFAHTLSNATVVIGETTYEGATVEIEGKFTLITDTEIDTPPAYYIEYQATVKPAKENEEDEEPEAIVINVRDTRLPAEIA